MQVEISQDFYISGYCPTIDENIEISATYKRYKPLGSERAYALPVAISCPHISECPVNTKCPVAQSKTYW